MLDDLQQDSRWAQGRHLQSLFFGGGTPSLFSPQAISQIIEGVDRIIGITEAAEITLEANPGTVEQARFVGYRSAGVNRLSIGIQSFQPRQLEKLGRIHSSDEAVKAIHNASIAGFDNVNIDLMHGLPQQSLEQAIDDLKQAIDLQPTHLSWYQLTIEPNTAFYSQPPAMPGEDLAADIEQAGWEYLASHGYQQYEVSAFSLLEQQSRHNLNYWQFGDYLGIGAGAHGKITAPDQGQVLRTQKTRLPEHYLDHIPVDKWRAVDAQQLTLEFMMNALRLNQGVELDSYTLRTGLELANIQPELEWLEENGLLQLTGGQMATTPLGQRFLNDVIARFMPEE
ncbi:radical SAM family heme chaperone HemW [Aurantivibrio plasticivorans]